MLYPPFAERREGRRREAAAGWVPPPASGIVIRHASPMKPSIRHLQQKRARELRHAQTSAEKSLWYRLKQLPLVQTHFRRQVSIGPFVVDFACLKHRLIIELDGPSHTQDDQQQRDAIRSAYLRGKGFQVLRFWNDDVYSDIDSVIDTILARMSGE